MNQPMIGLHNALTAHPAANFVGRLVTFAWRCQRPGAINRAIMQGIRFLTFGCADTADSGTPLMDACA